MSVSCVCETDPIYVISSLGFVYARYISNELDNAKELVGIIQRRGDDMCTIQQLSKDTIFYVGFASDLYGHEIRMTGIYTNSDGAWQELATREMSNKNVRGYKWENIR